MRTPGQWARRNVPRECFTVAEIAERPGLSRRAVLYSLKRHNVPCGLVTRKLYVPGVGRVSSRRAYAVTPTGLDTLIRRRGGFV